MATASSSTVRRMQATNPAEAGFSLSDKQAALRDLAATPATHVLAFGGARSGKTFGFCYCTGTRALSAPNSRHLISRLHNIDVRQAVMMDTWPKMMRLAYPGVDYETNKSDQYVTLGNGAEVWFLGLDDKDRVEKILGKEYATVYFNETSQLSYDTVITVRTRLAQNVAKVNGAPLRLKAYYDLNPVGRGHWTYKEFVEKVRPENGLPLDNPADYQAIQLNPTDNPHLPATTLAIYAAMPERQRKRFFDGAYLSEIPGALWTMDRIERLRRVRPDESFFVRIVVALDPSGSDGTGGDCQGIMVVGLGADGDCYVLADRSCRLPPHGWARQAVNAYHEFKADLIVGEINFGGAMVESTVRTADPNVHYRNVTASRGKHVRAEPVAALYEDVLDVDGRVIREGRVHHVTDPDRPGDEFAELEEQLGMFTTAGYQGGGSPDRADALVWAVTELMLQTADHAGFLAMVQAENAARRAGSDPAETPVQHQPGSVEWTQAHGDL
jgi:phage terminase large subunit-like protein